VLRIRKAYANFGIQTVTKNDEFDKDQKQQNKELIMKNSSHQKIIRK